MKTSAVAAKLLKPAVMSFEERQRMRSQFDDMIGHQKFHSQLHEMGSR